MKSKLYPKSVAFAPSSGWFVRYDSGDYAWDGLPPSLDKAIRRAKSHYKVGVKGVTVASDGGWIMTCTCGTLEWCGVPNSLAATLARNEVRRVTLGKAGTFFAWMKDGSTYWQGLPRRLSSLAKTHCISKLSLGCHGEWFAGFSDGSFEWEGTSDSVHDDLQTFAPESMTFGLDFEHYFMSTHGSGYGVVGPSSLLSELKEYTNFCSNGEWQYIPETLGSVSVTTPGILQVHRQQRVSRLQKAGNVKVLYHATSKSNAMQICSTKRFKSGVHGFLGPGIYFSSAPSFARRYCQCRSGSGPIVVLRCEVKMGNIKVVGRGLHTAAQLLAEGVDSLQERGRDCYMLPNNDDSQVCMDQVYIDVYG